MCCVCKRLYCDCVSVLECEVREVVSQHTLLVVEVGVHQRDMGLKTTTTFKKQTGVTSVPVSIPQQPRPKSITSSIQKRSAIIAVHGVLCLHN